MRLAQLTPAAIEDVVLVGGSTKIPYVRDRVTQFFQRPPRTDVNPEEAVAMGAALQASALERILSRKPTGRMPTMPGTAVTATGMTTGITDSGFEEVATSEKRTTAPMGVELRQPAPAATERPSSRGGAVDRFEEGTGTGAKTLGRITKPGAAAPPPIPSMKKTMVGVPAAVPTAPDLPLDEPTSPALQLPPIPAPVPTAPASQKTMIAEAPFDPFAPSAQPTLTFPHSGPPAAAPPVPHHHAPHPGLPGPAAFGSAIAAGPAGPAQQPTLIAGLGAGLGSGLGEPTFAPPPRTGPTVLDVTPRGLGIGTVAGYCEELIRRNSRVPTEMKRVFSTSRDRQDTVRIRVCQGDSRRIDDNVILGDLVLEGLQPRPRGETAIEVTFQIDHDGILRVRARDANTGKEQRASLDVAGAPTSAEVDAARERFANLGRR
jgi:molecular chaperone DnaK